MLASPVPPYAPGVRRYFAGRRGVAMGHPPGAWDYTEKPRRAAGVWAHASPLSPRLLERSPSPLNSTPVSVYAMGGGYPGAGVSAAGVLGH